MIGSLVGTLLLVVLFNGPLPAQKQSQVAVVESSRGRNLATRCADGVVYAVSENPDLASIAVGKGQRAFGIARGKLAVAREDGELVVINLETAGEVEVAEGFAVVRAAWSSDRETLAAILQREGAFYAILYGETRGTVWFPRLQPVDPRVLRWSADGRTLTYAERGINGDITLVLWSEGEDRRIPVGQMIPQDLLDEPRTDQSLAASPSAKAVPSANAAPANDEPAGAILISTLPFTQTQDMSQSTANGLESNSCQYQSGAVWFRFSAVNSGYLDIDTAGSTFAVLLSVYEGPAPANPASRCTISHTSPGTTKLTVAVAAGHAYWISAGGSVSTGSSLTIRITQGWNRPPSLTDVFVPSGPVGGQFTLFAADVNGVSDLRFAQILVNSSLTSVGGCYVHFDLAGQTVYLMNSSGTGWMGPLANNSSATLGNGICTVSAPYFSPYLEATGASVSIEFTDVKNGAQSVFARVVDSIGQDSQWQNRATVTLDTLPPPPGLIPTASWGTGGTFSLLLNDPYGPSHVSWAQFLVTSDLTSNLACYIHYDRAGGALYLATDNGAGWTGPLTVASGQTLANGQCTVQSPFLPTTGSTWLNLPLVIRFRDPSFRGTKQILARVVTIANRERAWTNTNQGYEVTGVPRVASSVDPFYTQPGKYSVGVSVAHPDGYASVPWMQVIFARDQSSVASCYIHLDRAGSQVWLMADDGYTWSPARTFGVGPALTNSQCSVDVASVSVSLLGNTVQIRVPVTFPSSTFFSSATPRARTVDAAGRDSGWSTNNYLPLY